MTVADTRPYLPFARPSITEREKQAVLEVLDSGWLTTGPRTKEFEERFAATVGARHAVALNSATAALHLALEALGVGPRGRGHRADLDVRRERRGRRRTGVRGRSSSMSIAAPSTRRRRPFSQP